MRTCKIILPVALATACMACQHTEPGIRTVEVEVPVPQPCLTEEQLAEDRFQPPPLVGNMLGRTPETAEQDRDILAGSVLRLRAWGMDLLAAHVACAKDEN